MKIITNYIDGNCKSYSKEFLNVEDPSTGEIVSKVVLSNKEDFKKLIESWESDKNLILVTHFVVISELLNKGTSSGEMILTDKKLTILGNLEIN